MLKIVRDHIIQKNCQIREAFKIQSIQTDVMVLKAELKNTLKEIAGTEATFGEISKALEHFSSFSKE